MLTRNNCLYYGQRITDISCFPSQSLENQPAEAVIIGIYHFSSFTAFESQRVKDISRKRSFSFRKQN